MWNLLIYTKKNHKNIYKYFKDKLEMESFINNNVGISVIAKCYNIKE